MRDSATVQLYDGENEVSYEVTYHWVEDSNGMEGSAYFEDCSHIEIDSAKLKGVEVNNESICERLEDALNDMIAMGQV